MLAAIFLTIQAVTAQPVSMTELGAPIADAAPAAAVQPERKRVCRTQMDTRTGLIAKTRKICTFVDADPGKADRAD